MVLRLLTLVQFVARRNLAAEGATLSGLYAGAPKKAPARPTAERLLVTFEGVTVYTVHIGQHLQYIGLPLGVYTALETG